MLETARYELGRKRRGIVTLIAGLSIVAGFFIALFPGFRAAGGDIDELIEAWPPALREAFGIETISTIEGFLAVELYNFVWLLVLGLYVAYSAAGVVTDDIEHDRMDLLLTFPVSRVQLLAEKFLPLLVTIVVLNAVVAAVVYASVLAISEPIDPHAVLAVHALSLPYLFVCAGLGLVLSTVLDRTAIAQRAAIGAIFGLYLVETVAAGVADLSWLQYISPTHYYNPTTILVRGTYELLYAGTLSVVFVLLMAVSIAIFRRRDI